MEDSTDGYAASPAQSYSSLSNPEKDKLGKNLKNNSMNLLFY